MEPRQVTTEQEPHQCIFGQELVDSVSAALKEIGIEPSLTLEQRYISMEDLRGFAEQDYQERVVAKLENGISITLEGLQRRVYWEQPPGVNEWNDPISYQILVPGVDGEDALEIDFDRPGTPEREFVRCIQGELGLVPF